MSRQLSAIALVAAGLGQHATVASAQPAPSEPMPSEIPASQGAPSEPAPEPSLFPPIAPRVQPAPAPPSAEGDIGDQEISAQIGLAGGGRVTPGGVRVAGHYLYQLSARDWFDAGALFTFGSGDPACFRDRENHVVCKHGLTDGTGFTGLASVRHMLDASGAFHPFFRIGLGLGLARFSDDDVSGLTVTVPGSLGVRVKLSSSVAVVAEGEAALGFGKFRKAGTEPQFGLAITAGAEFRLR